MIERNLRAPVFRSSAFLAMAPDGYRCHRPRAGANIHPPRSGTNRATGFRFGELIA